MQNYFFRDYPKSKSTNDYEKIRNKIIKYFKNDKNLFSIYEYGQVKAPGISDLDIILVLKKKK